jgi:hypothetical protein
MIEVKIESEIVTVDQPAKVQVFEDGKLVTTVTARIVKKQGADSRFYPAIELIQSPA